MILLCKNCIRDFKSPPFFSWMVLKAIDSIGKMKWFYIIGANISVIRGNSRGVMTFRHCCQHLSKKLTKIDKSVLSFFCSSKSISWFFVKQSLFHYCNKMFRTSNFDKLLGKQIYIKFPHSITVINHTLCLVQA